MKNSRDIITHLKLDPSFKNLEKYECFEKIKSIFPPYIQDGVAFMYGKNSTIFVVFAHQALQMDFNYKLNMFSRLLSDIKKHNQLCSEFDDIKAIVTNKPIFHETKRVDEVMRYFEESDGEFANPYDDEELATILEEIKEIIQTTLDAN